MITEEEKQDNYLGFELTSLLSVSPCVWTARQPDLPAGLPTRTWTEGTTEQRERYLQGVAEYYRYQDHPNAVEQPRLVTRGPHKLRSTPPTQKNLTKVDTLSFTAKEAYWIIQELVELSCPGVNFVKLKFGKNGYHSGFAVTKDKREIAQIYYGSKSNEKQNQRPQLNIGGNGKTDEFDWNIFYHYANLLELPKITRADICLDLFDGLVTIEDVIKAHTDGEFKAPKSSKNPRITPYGQIQPDGQNFGRTIYIGALSSSKIQRCYEKGFEQFKSILNSEEEKDSLVKMVLEDNLKNSIPLIVPTFNNDEPIDLAKWIRFEIQLRNSNQDIPMDILINPDEYFVGASAFNKRLIDMNQGKKPIRFKPPEDVSIAVRVHNHKAITGSLIDDLLCLGWSDNDIVNALKAGKGASQKLIKSGVYKDC